MSRPHWIKDVADALLAEMTETAETTAKQLAPPADAFDGSEMPRSEYLALNRALSYDDPAYIQRDLDRMAPPSIPLPDGRMLRSLTGLKNFLRKWEELRPDLYAAAVVEPVPTLVPAATPDAMPYVGGV